MLCFRFLLQTLLTRFLCIAPRSVFSLFPINCLCRVYLFCSALFLCVYFDATVRLRRLAWCACTRRSDRWTSKCGRFSRRWRAETLFSFVWKAITMVASFIGSSRALFCKRAIRAALVLAAQASIPTATLRKNSTHVCASLIAAFWRWPAVRLATDRSSSSRSTKHRNWMENTLFSGELGKKAVVDYC